MDIIICGAGQVGFGITEKLIQEGHNITIIDLQSSLVESISELFDVKGVVGFASHPDVLERAGAADADMLIAVTQSDEVNMMSCQIAHSLFDVTTKLARIRSQSYLQPQWQNLFSRDNMPIDVIISPEIEVGEEIIRRLSIPGAKEYSSLVNGEVCAVAVDCDERCAIVDTPLNQLNTLFPDLSATIVGINRDENTFTPHSDDVLLTGDVAFIICQQDQLARTLSIFGHDEEVVQRVVIGGGGNVGRYLARELESRNISTRIKVIERDPETARIASQQLEHSVVLQGDICASELLEEANIAHADLFVSLTNDDQSNLLSSVLAKRGGAERTMCLLNNPNYHDLVEELHINSFVNPRSVTISSLLKHIRRGKIRAAYSFQHATAEVLAIEALTTTPIVGKKLRDMNRLENIRIGGVYRKGKFIKPSGELIVQAHDIVIVFYHTNKIEDIEKLFTVSIDYIG